MPARSHKVLALSVCLVGWLACSGNSAGPGGTGSSPGSAGTGSQAAGTAGDSGSAGATGSGQAGGSGSGQAGGSGSGTAGVTGAAGGTTGAAGGNPAGTAGAVGAAGSGAGTAGAGTAGTGAAGTGASGTGVGGMTGADPCDTPPWRALHVTATAALHAHTNGVTAAVDGRAKPLGKLVVSMDVSGTGFPIWLVKRGYHGMGSGFPACAAPNLGAGRDAVGNCRITQEWGKIKSDTLSMLQALAKSNPEEDWGYFLTQDGTAVRWSDVAFTGASHGATTSAIIGRIGACVWRVVSCAGPRDNTCGKGGPPFPLPYDPAHPPFDPNCPDADVASWLDMPTKTPMNRFYVIDGVSDGEYGDIMFNVQRTMYPGQPVQFDVPGAVLTGTNRFISLGGGHLNFLTAADTVKPMNTDAVLNISFAIPVENQNPTF